MNKNLYMAILWLAVGWLACHALRVAEAETYYVATNGVDTRDGKTYWTNAVLTISNAVKYATTINDLILVSNGEYLLTAQITVSSQITVRGWNNGVIDSTNTIVNGNASTRCFTISHTGAVVEGLTIYKGNGSGSVGGGVRIDAGTLRNCLVVSNSAPNNDGGGVWLYGFSTNLVDNCLIAHNIATNGGGIYFYQTGSGSIIVTNCVIRNNRATIITGGASGGGGVWMRTAAGGSAILANCSVYWNEALCTGGGIVTYDACVVKNCVISNNFAYLASEGGGGIKLYSGALITNCVIITNISNGYGGGIYMRDGTVANCRIIGNQLTNNSSSYGMGGGVFNYNTTGKILNSEIRDNFGGYAGGGVYLNNPAAIRNCLIAGNVAGGNYGGGVYLNQNNNVLENSTIVSNRGLSGGGGLYIVSGTSVVANCIVYFNSGGSSSNYGFNVGAGSFSNCCFSPVLTGASTNYSTNNITVDPQFVNKDTGNWRLKRGSPCINTGANRDWMTNSFDLDGRIRIRYGRVDMGAYERIYEGTVYRYH